MDQESIVSRKVLRRAGLYFLNLFLMLDLAVNTVLGGDPRETLSSRMGKQAHEGDCRVCAWICSLLDRIDPEHCKKSIDRNRGDWSGADRNVWR